MTPDSQWARNLSTSTYQLDLTLANSFTSSGLTQTIGGLTTTQFNKEILIPEFDELDEPEPFKANMDIIYYKKRHSKYNYMSIRKGMELHKDKIKV